MSPKRIIFSTFFLLTVFSALASPARRGLTLLTQPDGSTFLSTLIGDEFARIRKTAEGHAIIQGSDGWWYYAEYDADGLRRSSGCRVGEDVPSDVLSRSKVIPYEAIVGRAALRRSETARFADDELMKFRRMAELQTKSEPLVKHGLVILAEFKDVSFKHSKEDFTRLLTEDGYDLNGATGSAMEYFNDQFGGKVKFSFDVSSIVTLPFNRVYYGGNGSDGTDKAPADMVQDACIIADDEIDFSLYDDDGDGKVDNVFVFFAGSDEAEGAPEECLWSHAWYIYSGAGITLELDGVQIDRYACTSEISRRYTSNGKFDEYLSGIGTFCHEYSHTFGLPDFYDTDYEKNGGWAAGLWGCTSLMDSGNGNNHGNTPPNFNAIERELLGIAEAQVIEADGQYSLSPVNESNGFYRMETDTEDEYFLFECRSDKGWDAYIGGSGMLVYHIDRTSANLRKWTVTNDLNADVSHQCADLIEADGRNDSFSGQEEYISLAGNVKGIFYPYGDINSLTPDIGLKYWSGSAGKQSVTGIKKIGDVVIFNVVGGSEESTPPDVVNLRHDVFCDGAIISFESSRVFDGDAKVIFGRTAASEADTLSLKPWKPGHYAVTFNGLEPAKTYTATISFSIGEGEAEGKAASASFMTKKKPIVDWPYIYMGSETELKVGSRIPLRAYNAAGAASVHWTFEGKGISTGPDGYYEILSEGTLKAHITWDDGSTDVLMKEIIISE